MFCDNYANFGVGAPVPYYVWDDSNMAMEFLGNNALEVPPFYLWESSNMETEFTGVTVPPLVEDLTSYLWGNSNIPTEFTA